MSACSPDLPVIVLTLIGFDLWFQKQSQQHFYDLVVLAAFGLSIKLSAVFLILLPFGYAYMHWARLREDQKKFFISTLIFAGTGLLVVAKNIYLTGYAAFPFTFSGVKELPWTIPQHLLHYYEKGLKVWAVADVHTYKELQAFADLDLVENFQQLLHRTGYKRWINWMILVSSLAAFVFLLRDIRLKITNSISVKPVIIMAALIMVNLAVWLQWAPQYRFVLPLLIIFASYGAASMAALWGDFSGRSKIISETSIALIFAAGLLFTLHAVKIPGSRLPQNTFTSKNLITPHWSHHPGGTDSVQMNDQVYYHITDDNIYCWDCPVPCVPLGYIRFLKNEGNYTIRKLGKDVNSGFALSKQE